MNLAKSYQPDQYEADIYKLWESTESFKPSGEGEPYSIIMPPPNANGDLHIGHALFSYLQDILVRFYRMQGRDVIWIPGADHAGFETWVVYERELDKSGKSRFDFSRDQLYQQVWDFVHQHRGGMETQLRSLGASCDWSRLTFTLDPNVVAVAYRTFEKMWNEKLIYRGKRLVNFCTRHQTSFSDIEVEYKDTKTTLYYLKYGPFELATTRPETKFGDTAVAVHPDDERYKQYVGQEIEVEGVNGPFKIVVVADDMVDREFGTGVVKITPAHDFNDFEVAERHNLPKIEVIDKSGKMTDKAGRFAGLTVSEARREVVKALKEKGLLLREDDNYSHRIGTCYKCGTVIEPMLLDQWFVNVKPLAESAIRAIKHGEIKFTPENKGRVLIQYFEKLKDWNISRQIPWGIPIPAFQNTEDSEDWIFDINVKEETIVKDGKTYRRDPDTFDTWFSSSQWPFITTLFAESGGLEKFYPTSVLETGGDILYPWVSRMIMIGLYVTEQVPFKDVYLHGLVLDPKGQKMSKSKGNVISPQAIIDEYGSDAVRMGLVNARSAGQNQAFSSDKVIAGRNFCNKLWNITRYIENRLGDNFKEVTKPQPQTAADHWIISELVNAKQTVASLLSEYRFAEATESVYHTVWDKVADWYIEASKSAREGSEDSNLSMLPWVLESCLILAHPFAPFVTETIWQTLDWHNDADDLLITTKWQYDQEFDASKVADFENIQGIVSEVRQICKTIKLKDVELITTEVDIQKEFSAVITQLSPVKSLTVAKHGQGLRLVSTHNHIWVNLNNKQIEQYTSELKQTLSDIEQQIEVLSKRLNNDSYTNNAPKELVEESRGELAKKLSQAEHLKHQLTQL